jgi:hypothetical protein
MLCSSMQQQVKLVQLCKQNHAGAVDEGGGPESGFTTSRVQRCISSYKSHLQREHAGMLGHQEVGEVNEIS